MRYIDSGSRESSQAFGTWISEVVAANPTELRLQSGFFSADALSIIEEQLGRMREETRLVRILIGSNEGSTIRADLESLVSLIGLPRDNALLGVIRYHKGYFHPKTFHVRFSDGNQAAYVGSANFTPHGVSSLHVEAGMLLDTRDGDPVEILSKVASAVDFWFNTPPASLSIVSSLDDIPQLVADEIISEVRPPRPQTPISTGKRSGDRAPLAQLAPLISLPRFKLSQPQPSKNTVGTAPKSNKKHTTSSDAEEVLLMRVKKRRDGKQIQISKRVHKAPFMNGAEEVVLTNGSRRTIGSSVARGGKNTTRFEDPELLAMKNPVARFRWVAVGDSGSKADRILQFELFDADSGGVGAEIFSKLEEGIATPPVTNLRKLSQKETVISKSNRAKAQWYRLATCRNEKRAGKATVL